MSITKILLCSHNSLLICTKCPVIAMYVTYEFFIKISILYIIFFVTKFPFWGGVDGGRPLCFGMCDGVTYDRNVYTLFFSARLPKKGNFVTKKMMYKIEIFIKNSYVTYIAHHSHVQSNFVIHY